jgi:hypothetical protein
MRDEFTRMRVGSMETARVLKKKSEIKFCSQMYEVFDSNEAYVV